MFLHLKESHFWNHQMWLFSKCSTSVSDLKFQSVSGDHAVRTQNHQSSVHAASFCWTDVMCMYLCLCLTSNGFHPAVSAGERHRHFLFCKQPIIECVRSMEVPADTMTWRGSRAFRRVSPPEVESSFSLWLNPIRLEWGDGSVWASTLRKIYSQLCVGDDAFIHSRLFLHMYLSYVDRLFLSSLFAVKQTGNWIVLFVQSQLSCKLCDSIRSSSIIRSVIEGYLPNQ